MSHSHRRRVGQVFMVVSIIVGLLHYYLGVRILHALPIGDVVRGVGWGLIILSGVTIPSAMLARFLVKQQALSDAIAWVGLTAMGLFSSLLVLTLARDLIFALGYFLLPNLDWEWLLRISAEGVLGLSLAATLIGFVNVRRIPAIVTVDIPIKNLPAALQHCSNQ